MLIRHASKDRFPHTPRLPALRSALAKLNPAAEALRRPPDGQKPQARPQGPVAIRIRYFDNSKVP